MFPKEPVRKRRSSHAGHSILQKDTDRRRCWLCMQAGDYRERTGLHKHHVYMGPLRRVSEAEGFYVWLCHSHHVAGRSSVHRDTETCRNLQMQMQAAYERNHTREEFRALIGKSYL